MINRFSKSLLILGVVSLLTAGAAFAQSGKYDAKSEGKYRGKGNPNVEQTRGPAHNMARLSQALELTPEQEDAILTFFRDRQAERDALRERIMEDYGDEICAQRAASEAAFEDLLYSILDDEQLAAHEEMKANREARQAKRQNRRGGGGIGGGFECPEPAEG